MSGQVPRLEDIDVKSEHLNDNNLTWFQTRLNFLLRKERLVDSKHWFISACTFDSEISVAHIY